MKRSNITILMSTVIAIACGNDPVTNAGYFDDDLDRSVDQSVHDDHSSNTTTITTTTTTDDHSTVTIDDHSHVTNNYFPDTVYVRDTIRTRDTVSRTVRDTVLKVDTITVHTVKHDTITKHKVDTVTTTVYDTVLSVKYDTVYRELPISAIDDPLDTLPELPDGVTVEHVIMKLSGSSLIVGSEYAQNTPTFDFIVQGADIDTLKNIRAGYIVDRPTMVRVSPINKCIGILAFRKSGYSGFMTDYAYKVCDHLS